MDANSKLGRRRIKMGNEVSLGGPRSAVDQAGPGLTNFQVEFTVLPDPIPKTNQRGRCHATRIVHLKPTKNERSKGKYCSLAPIS